jgi:hypothetical protein
VRLRRDLRLQNAFKQLHRCDPQRVGMFVCELVDALDIDPMALDWVLTWRRGFAPEIVAAIGGEFPPPPLHLWRPS